VSLACGWRGCPSFGWRLGSSQHSLKTFSLSSPREHNDRQNQTDLDRARRGAHTTAPPQHTNRPQELTHTARARVGKRASLVPTPKQPLDQTPSASARTRATHSTRGASIARASRCGCAFGERARACDQRGERDREQDISSVAPLPLSPPLLPLLLSPAPPRAPRALHAREGLRPTPPLPCARRSPGPRGRDREAERRKREPNDPLCPSLWRPQDDAAARNAAHDHDD